MKANVYNIDGSVAGSVELPAVFNEPLRLEAIKRAVLSQQSARRQRYGADTLAGKRSSAHYHGKRRYRFAMMNREMSRLPRIHGRGAPLMWRGRVAPHTVKGRKAHPPKAEKQWEKRINRKERAAAIRSALAAAARMELVQMRHRVSESPVVVADSFEALSRTKDVYGVLAKLAEQELRRCAKRRIRAGRGKMRGRRYAKKRGPLVIASSQCALLKAARNIAGVDAATAQNLNAELLAPGAKPGRFVVVTQSALAALEKRFGPNG